MTLFTDPRWEPYGLLREAYLVVTARVDAVVSPAGGSDPALSDLLFRLARTPSHALRSTDITRALATSTTRTTRLVDEAERRGWVARRPHPDDRRAVLVSLTPDGLAEATRRGHLALEVAQRCIHDVLEPEAIEQMTAALRTLRDANLGEA